MRKPGRKPVIPDSKVREIRGQWAEWKALASSGHPYDNRRKGYKALGDAFGLSRWTVRDIVTNRTRRDLLGPTLLPVFGLEKA